MIEYVWEKQQELGRPLVADELTAFFHCPAMVVHSRVLDEFEKAQLSCALPLEYAEIYDLDGDTYKPTGEFVYWATRPHHHWSKVE